MVIVQKRSQRKPSGARYKDTLTKRVHQTGSAAARTAVGAIRRVAIRLKGGSVKNRLLAADVINVFDPAKKKHVKAKLESVADNTANRHFIRRNIITKGAVVNTDMGKVRITNRPGQEGTLNGVKVQE